MPELDRKTRICQQATPVLTGIDFIQVVDHTTQDVLHVFFLIGPALVDGGAAFPRAVTLTAMNAQEREALSITAPHTGDVVDITSAAWIEVIRNGVTRKVLEITVAEPGGAELYEFRYQHTGLDRFFDHITFSFKQGCPSGTDCLTDCDCPPQDLRDVAVDYLARDYGSLRNALLDFAATHYPEWESRIEADPGMMMLEIMAAQGDDFAYQQDRLSAEGYLQTATQTQSIANLARLVDYDMDLGRAATTPLAFGVHTEGFSASNENLQTANPDRVFAIREGLGAIPFELTEEIWLHPNWNSAALYLPDAAEPCLPIGATSAYLQLPLPIAGEMPPVHAYAPLSDIWLGRNIILRSGQTDPANPKRAWLVTITAVEPYSDLLNPGVGQLSHITWDTSQALPFEMPVEDSEAYLNVVNAVAGRTVTDTFRVGDDGALAQAHPTATASQLEKLAALPGCCERQGGCSQGVRGVVLRYGLTGSQNQGLSWGNGEDRQTPILSLVEIDPDLSVADTVTYTADAASQVWDYVPSILNADAEDRAFTLEHGLWTEAVRFQKPSGDVVLQDYVSNDGFSLRFGDREFGLAPPDGTVLQARYLTAPGADANLPVDTVTFLDPPEGGPDETVVTYADWVTNPLAVTPARPLETLDSVRMNAPQEFRAILLRAVRNEDYREILERRDTIQQANATSRWTGSWTTDFIAVDPMDTETLSPELRQSLETELDCIRQAGRSVCLRDADYVPIDLRIDVCLEPDASNAAMVRKITERLTSRRSGTAFFDPDNFSFGVPLIRSDLEAEVHCVKGVRGVESIQVRRRGWHGFQPLPARLETAPHQILQLANDPARPELGHVEISAHGGG